MKYKIKNWFKERIDIGGMIGSSMDEKIPGGVSFFYTLGSATLFIFVLQFVTGFWQLFYYVPTTQEAYNSLSYFRTQVSYGWLIQGIHYWGANILSIMIALHMIRVFIWGAYKKPRELTWLFGLGLLLLTTLLIFTGALLPWDERGYWAGEVGTSIAGTLPIFGLWLEKFLRGGVSMGQLTLSRFFALHTAIIPVITLIFIALHLMAFRRFGSVGPWKESKRKKIGDFWPNQIAIDLVVSSIIFLLIVYLSAFHGASFTGPADPSDSAFIAKPEWNFLFLYQLLKLFKGPLEIVGTVLIPTIILALLVLVPFIDRKESKSPAKRIGMMIGGLVFVGFILTFTIIGYNSHPPEGKKVATSKIVSYKLSPDAINGEKVFNKNACIACHSISGKGGKIGPDLTNLYLKKYSSSWMITQITDSKVHFPSSIMPDYTALSKEQLNNLVAFLNTPHKPVPRVDSSKMTVVEKKTADSINLAKIAYTKKTLNNLKAPGKAASIIGNVKVGRKLFIQQCASCHGLDGKGGVPNFGSTFGKVPALNPISTALFSKSPKQFAENIDRFIQHGAVPSGAKPTLDMIAFGDTYSLTQPEIANIEAYVMSLNNINRARIDSPNSAKTFFYVTLLLFGFIFLLMIFFWQKARKNNDLNEE